MSENATNAPIPGDLYMLLGKMDGKMDHNLAATNSLAQEVKELAHRQNALDSRIAVLEKEADQIRKNGHEINNIKQALEGRSEQLRLFRDMVKTVDRLDKWSLDHDSQEKGQGKLVKIGQSLLPVALSIAAALGVSFGVKSSKGNEVKSHYESTTTIPVQGNGNHTQ